MKLPDDNFGHFVKMYRTFKRMEQAASAATMRAELRDFASTMKSAATAIDRIRHPALGLIEMETTKHRRDELTPLAVLARAIEKWSDISYAAARHSARKNQRGVAARMVAAQLWDMTLEGKRCTTTGWATAELVRIANAADDPHLTRNAAKSALAQTNPKSKAQIRP